MTSNRHCIFLEEYRLQFLRLATKEDIMTFMKWILDNYPRVRKQSSLRQYFRQFRMLRQKCVGQSLHAKIMEDVNGVHTCPSISLMCYESANNFVISISTGI